MTNGAIKVNWFYVCTVEGQLLKDSYWKAGLRYTIRRQLLSTKKASNTVVAAKTVVASTTVVASAFTVAAAKTVVASSTVAAAFTVEAGSETVSNDCSRSTTTTSLIRHFH